MKKKIIFILVLFLGVTGFNGESRIVEQSSINFQERVASIGNAPRIIKHLRDVTVYKGDVAIFEATVSTAVSSVTWFKDGVEILMGVWCYSTFKDYTAKLIIEEVYLEDEGKYSVQFKNAYGSVTSTAELTVKLP